MRALNIPLAALLGALVFPATVLAEPVKVRIKEGAARGFLVLSDVAGAPLAYGELVQWLDEKVVVSTLTFQFTDGSTYEETVRFSQDRVFRLLFYHLEQRGRSFNGSTTITFDRAGRYDVRMRGSPDKEEEHKVGEMTVPEDVMNGMTSVLLKNRMGEGQGAAKLLAFTPEPVVLDVALIPEGTDQFWVGRTEHAATRFRIEPKVPGVKGVLATLTGKQPPSFRMWIAQGKVPVLVRFEGPLFAEGPIWRIGTTPARFEK